MSEMIVCRHCQESFVLSTGKPGYRDECPGCLIERAMAARPDKSKVEEFFAASGQTSEQIAKSVVRFRRIITKLLRECGCSEQTIEKVMDEFEMPTNRSQS